MTDEEMITRINNEEIKMPPFDGKLAYCICDMDADYLCEILKKEVSFGVLMEVIQKLNADILRSIWRGKNDR